MLKCGVCMKGVGENESGVLCELCEQWWHTGCAKTPEEVYKVLDKIPNLHWYCEICNNSASKMLKNVSFLNDKISQLEIELGKKAEKEDNEKLKERVTKIESMIVQQRKDTEGSLREVQKNIEEMDQSL